MADEAPTHPDPEAIRIEARAYEHGEGVQKDVGKALALYCKAARLGNVEAQFDLGWMYANARGGDRDDATAAYFFGLAANQGHRQAQRMLAYVGNPRSTAPDCMRDPAAESQRTALESASPSQKPIVELLFKLAPEYGVDPLLGLAVIRAESNFQPDAKSPKNAQGLMQLIPETSIRFNVLKPLDPEQNIRGGLAYLRWLLAYYKGDVALVAAAYNAGEGTVDRYKGIPPYPETQQYVKQILQSFKKNEHPYDPAVTDPSPGLPAMRVSARL
jgi:hypothetical protein